MSFTAGFVEYIVSGCTAMLWILLLFPRIPSLHLPDSAALLFLPVLYGIGMLIDIGSFYALQRFQRRIHKHVKVEAIYPPDTSPTISIIITHPDLGRELLVRAHRVRTARGTLLNFFILTVLLGLLRLPSWLPYSRWELLPFSAGLTLLSFISWRRFEYLVETFKRESYRQLKKVFKSRFPTGGG